MTMRKRMVMLGLTVLALMLLSMTMSMARSWPSNPLFLSAGIREEGAYQMVVPGTYGHLIPIRPFPWGKGPGPIAVPTPVPSPSDEGSTGGALSATQRPGSGSLGTAPPSGKLGTSNPAGSENMGMPMGNMLSGAIASNHVDSLENDLRHAIRKLNAK